MTASRRYLARDLFEFGHTAQWMAERAHSFWFWGFAEDDQDLTVPRVLAELVEEVLVGLRNLAEKDLGEDTNRLAKEAELSLTAAWSAYQQRWRSQEHRRIVQGIHAAEGILAPEAAVELSPLATAEWSKYRTSLKAIYAALPASLTIWTNLGGRMAQVLSLGDDEREQDEIMGERFPIHALQDVLRVARDAHPEFSDLDLELSDSRTNTLGFVDVALVQRKVKTLRNAILDRLGKYIPDTVASKADTNQCEPEVLPRHKSPSDEAIKAYRASFSTGMNQKELAGLLSKELHKPVSQGQVSRWLTSVKKWLEKRNVLPDLPELTHKPQSVDPRVIDMGKREDRHTSRQRQKKCEEQDGDSDA